jgi:hypothetical protein
MGIATVFVITVTIQVVREAVKSTLLAKVALSQYDNIVKSYINMKDSIAANSPSWSRRRRTPRRRLTGTYRYPWGPVAPLLSRCTVPSLNVAA